MTTVKKKFKIGTQPQDNLYTYCALAQASMPAMVEATYVGSVGSGPL